jgi:hypothetical protein
MPKASASDLVVCEIQVSQSELSNLQQLRHVFAIKQSTAIVRTAVACGHSGALNCRGTTLSNSGVTGQGGDVGVIGTDNETAGSLLGRRHTPGVVLEHEVSGMYPKPGPGHLMGFLASHFAKVALTLIGFLAATLPKVARVLSNPSRFV